MEPLAVTDAAAGRRRGRPRKNADNDADSAGYTVLKGVGRAMAILEALSERPMRAKELVDHLGLKWTTAYRTLAHLEEQEYLRRDRQTGEYSVGPRLYLLGSSYLVTDPLAPIAPPHLQAASARMKCAAQANERQGVRVITVAAVDSPTPIRKTSAGFHFPLGVAAKGRLLLAFAPPDVQEAVLAGPLVAFTQFTITDPDALRDELARIAEVGRAVTRDDLQVGVGSLAAPVRGREGEVLGCVSLIVNSARMDDKSFLAEFEETVDDAAHNLSMALGYRPMQMG
jgi:DNA-binding IclR family transcriptional regulator